VNVLDFFNIFLIASIILMGLPLFYKRFKQGNLSCIFYLYHFLIFGISQILGFILETDTAFPIEVRTKANIIVILSMFFFYLGEIFIFQSINLGKINNLKKNLIFEIQNYRITSSLLWVSLILSIIGFFVIIRVKGIPLSSMLYYETRTVYRLQGSNLGLTLGGFLTTLSLIATYIALIKRSRMGVIMCILVAYLNLALGGARAYIFLFLGPFFYYLVNIKEFVKKIKFGGIMIIILLSMISLIFFEALHLWRWQETRTIQNLLNVISQKETYVFFLQDPMSEFNYRIKLFQAVELFPEKYDWLYGNTYKNVLLFWLPSGMSKGIKIDTIYKFSDAIYGKETSYIERQSIQPGFVGDCYINFGYLFWFISFIWGMMLSIVYIMANTKVIWNLIFGSSLTYFLVLSMRGSIYLAFYAVIVISIFIITFVLLANTILKVIRS